jgi:hypothetical protein
MRSAPGSCASNQTSVRVPPTHMIVCLVPNTLDDGAARQEEHPVRRAIDCGWQSFKAVGLDRFFGFRVASPRHGLIQCLVEMNSRELRGDKRHTVLSLSLTQ